MISLILADTGSFAAVNGQVSIHPGKETLDELADKEQFFQVTLPFALPVSSHVSVIVAIIMVSGSVAMRIVFSCVDYSLSVCLYMYVHGSQEHQPQTYYTQSYIHS